MTSLFTIVKVGTDDDRLVAGVRVRYLHVHAHSDAVVARWRVRLELQLVVGDHEQLVDDVIVVVAAGQAEAAVVRRRRARRHDGCLLVHVAASVNLNQSLARALDT